jgi:hypothetical protein
MGVAAAAAGSLLVYSGVRGARVTGTLRSLLSGSPPPGQDPSLAVGVPSGGAAPGYIPPAGASGSKGDWAGQLLGALGMPATAANVAAVVAWENAEGGGFGNVAAFNPLNTTQPEPGSHAINGVGVQAYTSWGQGLQATVTTLNNGNYGHILAALRAGNDAQAVADAVALSPWGTAPFQVPPGGR